MSAPVSVIIPTLNAASALGPTLGTLVAGAADGLIGDVVLADGGSKDAIALIAEEAGGHLFTSKPGRGVQLAAGAKEARGEWLLFLHADTVLLDDWISAIRRHIERHPDKAGYFSLQFDSDSFGAKFVGGWANWRSSLFGLPYGDQGLLISRRLYEESGGYPAVPLMEDVALIRSIGRRRLRRMEARALTSPERYLSDGWWRRGIRNWRCLVLYFMGVSPERIAKIYQR